MRTTWLCTCTSTGSGILVGCGHRCSCRFARRPRRQRPSRPGRSPPTRPASRATRGPAASVRSATPAPPRPTAGPAGCAPRAPTPVTGVPRSASSAPVQSPARRSRTTRATSAGCRCQTAAAPAAVRLSSFAPCIWRNHYCLSCSALLDAQLKASFWWLHHIMGPPRHCCLLQLGVCRCKSFLLSCVNMPQTCQCRLHVLGGSLVLKLVSLMQLQSRRRARSWHVCRQRRATTSCPRRRSPASPSAARTA